MNDNKCHEPQFNKMKELLRDSHKIEKPVVWIDLIINFVLSWPLLIYSCFNPNFITYIISLFFLYRGTMLIHEVVHIAKKVPGYRLAYNLLFGWPTSYPAYIFDTHLFHHGNSTYGTLRDPEYKYIENYDAKMLIKPLLSSALLPFFQLIRFGILPFLTPFLGKNFQRKLYEKYSTLVFSMRYVRKIKNEEKDLRAMMGNDLASALYKIMAIVLLATKVLPMNFIFFFYGGFVIGSSLNMYRALFNHLYANETETTMSKKGHMLDSVTIDGGIFTPLIFINGLNYHTIHHIFPDIPYYKLKKAHQIISRQLAGDEAYKKTVYKNIRSLVFHCIRTRSSADQVSA